MILIDTIDNKVVMHDPKARAKPLEFTRDEAIDLAARLLDRALRCAVTD